MPSIVVETNVAGNAGDRKEGMRLLGEAFNAFFKQTVPAILPPVEVVKRSFDQVLTGDTKAFLVDDTGKHKLNWAGTIDPGNTKKVVFVFQEDIDNGVPPGQQRKVKAKVEDDGHDGNNIVEMNIAITDHRENLLDPNAYLSETVKDIRDLDANNARMYALAAITFSRCK